MYPTIYWGDLLRELREKHYMLQKEVADLLHTSRQSYSNLENGRTQPTPEQLAALSYIYDENLLDYVRKCLPAQYVAEQAAYRTNQSMRVAEVELEREAEAKASEAKAAKKSREEPAPDPEGENPVQPHSSPRRKRRAATQFHNTSGMSSVDLLRSSHPSRSVPKPRHPGGKLSPASPPDNPADPPDNPKKTGSRQNAES